jgi:hypothetical protein
MTKPQGGLLLLEQQAPPPPPATGTLIEAIDTSSHNSLTIGSIIDQYKPGHVIVRAYQSIELSGNGAAYSIAQAATARQKGCTVGSYLWLYAGIDGARQVTDALITATRAGIVFGSRNPFWIDLETYTDGSHPSLITVQQAVAECERRGVPCGIYTAKWYWTGYMGNSLAFADLPLWDANYVGEPRLVVPTYGGWGMRTLAGTQWSGNPVDRSVFKAEYASP